MLRELLALCKRYADMGDAIQQQLDDVVEAAACGNDPEDSEVNPNAIQYARERFLYYLSRSEIGSILDDELTELNEWLDRYKEMVG